MEVIPGISSDDMRQSKKNKMEMMSPTLPCVEEENEDIADSSSVPLLESISVYERATQLSQISLQIQEVI